MNKKSAVIQLQGHQYLVEENQQLLVDHIDQPENHITNISQILLLLDENQRYLGTPYLKNALATIKIVEHLKSSKIHVSTYKAKSRYRRQLGHRALLTRIIIEKLSSKAAS